MTYELDPRANWDLPPWLWSDWRVPHLPLGIYAVQVGLSSIYIGSGSLMERFRFHWKRLSLGRHNTLIQAAVDQVGPSMIRFDALQCAPAGTPKAALEEAEYSIMASYIDDGWTILNVLLPAAPGSSKRFSIGHGGKWKRAA